MSALVRFDVTISLFPGLSLVNFARNAPARLMNNASRLASGASKIIEAAPPSAATLTSAKRKARSMNSPWDMETSDLVFRGAGASNVPEVMLN